MKTRTLPFFVISLLSLAAGLWAAPEWIEIDSYNDVSALLTDGDYMWVGRTGNGLVRVKRTASEKVAFTVSNSGLHSDQVNCLAKGPDGELWIGTSLGLARLNSDNTWQIYEYGTADYGLANGSVQSLAVDLQGTLWVGTYDGLGKFDRNSTWTSVSAGEMSITGTNITALSVDGSGHVWAGVLMGGVAKFNGSSWVSFTAGIPNSVKTIVVSGQTLWVGTLGGLAKYSGSVWTTYSTVNSQIPSNLVYSMAAEPNGTLWVGTLSGLARLSGNSWSVYKSSTHPSLPTDQIRALSMDIHGNVWIGTLNGKLVAYKEGGIASVRRQALAVSPRNTLSLQAMPGRSGFISIQYRLGQSGNVVLRIIDTQGREIVRPYSGIQPEGEHEVQIRASDLAAGNYICELRSDEHSAVQTVIISK